MKKKKNIILDFTSLLDVTLIIIFFFVVFSHMEAEENKELLNEKTNELESIKEQDNRQQANNEAILEYVQGANIKIILDVEDEEDWIIRILHKGKVISEFKKKDDIGKSIKETLADAGYKDDDTIFCDFVFDGSLPKTASAYKKITKGIREVKEEYRYLYFSETDLSVGE